MTDQRWRLTLRGLGGTFVLLAVWAAIHPYSFTVVLANFGSGEVESGTDHLVRDFAACAATFGAGLLIADRIPAWRSPALALTALWNGLHAVGHVADIGKSHPAFVGPVEAALLIAVTALFARLTQLSIRADTPRVAGFRGASCGIPRPAQSSDSASTIQRLAGSAQETESE